MAQVANKLSKGRINIELFPDQQLGTGPQMIEMVKKGELDIFQGSAGMFSTMEPRLNVFDIPYLFKSVEQAYKVLDSKFGEEMLATLELHGLKGLSFWENGIRSTTNNVRPITKPDDIKGLKMRVMPANPVHVILWKGLGAEPTPLPFGEIYDKLKSGELDGQEHPIAPIYAGKFLEKFKAMPKATQNILLKASYAGAVKMRQFSNDNSARFLEEMKQKGVAINEVDAIVFREKMRPIVEKPYIEKNGDAWLKKINASLAEKSEKKK